MLRREGEFEKKSMPDVKDCKTYEEYQELGKQWTDEGFYFDKNIPNEDLQKTFDFYQSDSSIADIRLSSAFILPQAKHDYKGQLLLEHTGVWIKKAVQE